MKKSETPETKQGSAPLSLIKTELSQLALLNREYSDAQKTFMKGLINPDLTNNELVSFVRYAEVLQLNPFRKEIIAVVYNKNSADRVVNTIVTKDGKMTIARRTGQLDSVKSEAIYTKEQETVVYELDENGNSVPKKVPSVKEVIAVPEWAGGKLWGARATVVREGKEYTVTVPLAEYTTGKSTWTKMPSTMIKKVAVSQALTMAFPEILGGIYDDSEMSLENTSVKTVPASDKDGEPATEQQLTTLKALGVEYDPGMQIITFGEAKQKILEVTQTKK